MKKILICGLPGAGKTYLARELQKHLKYSAVIDGDDVRNMYGNDLGFSMQDRITQAQRMAKLAESMADWAGYVIASFVCPTEETRKAFGADYTIYVKNPEDRPSKYKDTIDVFEEPYGADHIVNSDDARHHSFIIVKIITDFIFEQPTTMFVGRFQPFHEGHKQLILKGMEEDETSQAWIGVRTMSRNESNPFSFSEIENMIYDSLKGHKVLVQKVPNISMIAYGRDVGYKVQKIYLPTEVEKISGTEIRKRLDIKA